MEKNSLKMPVQVNGKVRAVIEIPINSNKKDVEKIAMKEKCFKIFDQQAKKVIIPNRVINFVI